MSEPIQPYVKAQFEDGTWRDLEICDKHKVRFEREDNHLEEDMDKNESLKVDVVTGKG